MRKALLIALLLFPLASGVAGARLHPSLHALRLTPPTFRGTGFHPRERVNVSLGIRHETTIQVRADASGRFRVKFAAVPRCDAWTVRAVGSRGSRAIYRHPACAERSGVEGIVLRGPITPVCTAGDPCDAPVPDVNVQALQGESVVASTTTDHNGRFTLLVAPGDYTVRALGGATRPQQIHVSASKLTEVAFLIDTGIR